MRANKQVKQSVYNPLVTVIIGNYNYEQFIGKAIDSVLNQTYENIEIIVVDDGSTDNSRKIIDSYGDRIIPVFKENGGQPSNYNAGFASSKGDIICFLDSDDIFLPNKVSRIVSIFESYKDIGWCFHSLQLINDSDKLLGATTTVNYKSAECDYRSILRRGKIPPHLPPCPTLCFKRSLLEQILPMPTTTKMPGSDHYVKFMAVAMSKGFILAEDLTLQRIHSNNMGTLRKDIQHMKAREHLFTGYWINKNFSYLKKFADKLCGAGIALHWQSGNKDFENNQAIKRYFASASLMERLKISCISLYYYIKNR
ncbi:MAG: glycosyltransferase, partial [Rivularia sp. (in: cyanobacteria)]